MKSRLLAFLLSALLSVVSIGAAEPSPPPSTPFVSPQVTIGVSRQPPTVSIAGEVLRPQRLQWTAGMTVLSAISAAGGLTEYATGEVGFIRNGKRTKLSIKQIKGKTALDPELKPGDQIIVKN